MFTRSRRRLKRRETKCTHGRLTVSVVIKDGKISRVVCTGNVEDEPYITDAIEGVLGAMVERNTTNVDTVSSATTTSDALIEAVRKALDKAIPE